MGRLDKQLAVRVPPELLDLLNKEADKRGLNLTETIRQMLWNAVATPGNESNVMNALIYRLCEETVGRPHEDYDPKKHEIHKDTTGREWVFPKREKETVEES